MWLDFFVALLEVIHVLICWGLTRWIPTYTVGGIIHVFSLFTASRFHWFLLGFVSNLLTGNCTYLLRISNDEGQLLPFLNIMPINVPLNEGLSSFALSKIFWGFCCWIFILCFSSCFLFDFCCLQTWILTCFFSILSPKIIISFKIWNLFIHGDLT